MRSEFKAKLIQHMLNKKDSEKGFTLIELLVVIIIIGILAAIALPSFLNQAAKARQSEAKTYTGSMNRTQQAYYLEKQQFSPNLQTLAVGIAQTTENYAYGTVRNGDKTATGTDQSAFTFGFPVDATAVTTGTGTDPDVLTGNPAAAIKLYTGAINVATPTGTTEATTLATLLEGGLAPINGQGSEAFFAGDSTSGTEYFDLSVTAAPVPAAAQGTRIVAIN